nr:flagellar filament capping protein FliD [Zoogloeaceae bacterium]
MALIANGVGSGLDINGLVSQLMTVEARPATLLNTREASFQARLSAFGQLTSVLSPMQSALSSLKNTSTFQAMRATVGDSSVATALASTTAAKGNYSLEVQQIAQGQRVVSNATTAPTVAAGTLTFNFGSYSTDTTDPDNPVTTFTQTSSRTVTLEPGKDSLSDLRDAINDANIGVRAQIVKNGSIDQLIIAGNTEGTGGGFQISGSAGLAGFSYDASTGASSTLDELEKAQDAILKLDGVTLTRSSNSLTDVIEGVTLNILKADPGKPTKLTVAPDNTSVKTAIENLVKAYNEFNTTSRTLTSYDAKNKTSSILTGDSTVRSIQSQIRNALGASFPGSGGVSSLSEIGITFNRDGSLSITSSKLDSALNDPDKKVGELFTGMDGKGGLANSLSDSLDGLLRTGGVLDSRTAGINSSIKAIDEQRERLAVRLEMVEKRYRAQFIALDTLVGSLSQTSTFLTQQLANLPKLSSS